MNRQTQTLKMRQQMRLSPRQLQVLRLLAVPASAMHQFLDEELQRNPLMEVAMENKEAAVETPAQQSTNDSDDIEDLDDTFEALQPTDYDPNRKYTDPVIPLSTSLNEHLYEQLALQHTTERQQLIGKVLIGNIADNGYLTRDIQQVSDDLLFKYHTEATDEEIEQVLHIIQRMDPPGIGARNLQECLSVQLEMLDGSRQEVKDASLIIGRTFNDFMAQRHDRIKERLGLSDQALHDALNLILTLNPKPSSAFGSDNDGNHYIIPDFILDREDDRLTLSLADQHRPLLSIAPDYAEQIQQLETRSSLSPGQKEALRYMHAGAASIEELGEVLDERNATMLKVMRAIAKRQNAYLLSGAPGDMVPLRLQDIADDTGLDISTVSRVVTRKYLRAPFGTILLKELFAKNVSTAGGTQVASTAVLDVLRQTIAEEDKRTPLTDDQLATLLKEKGYPMARRTVAKYRESLGIPVGRLRRRMLSLLLPLLLAANMLLPPTLSLNTAQAQQPKVTGSGNTHDTRGGVQPMSYYDSLILLEQRKSGPSKGVKGNSAAKQQKASPTQKNDTKNSAAASPNTTSTPKANPAAKKSATATTATDAPRNTSPQPTAAKPATGANATQPDTALIKADEMIDRAYAESLLPSPLWYDDNFSDCRVRLCNIPLEDMPDEINIKLVNSESDFCFPIRNIITSPYGWRWNRAHRGVDIRLNTGDPVRCCFPGVVRIAKPMGAYGNLVVVRHYNGLETVYGHLSKIKVRPKQHVKAGDVLGLGGSTGRSTGPHLHFEVRFQYETFDPEWILDFSNYTLRTRWLHLDKSYFGITAPRGSKPQVFKADKSHIAETPHRVHKQVYHDVKKGDRLDHIAISYSTTEENIYRLNPNLTKLKPGMRIRVR
ncbi:MAG: RNA polymerase factor sigma-54 [Bacteroidales bacterium]|nr:RNA polymerase factor sigma-54 [Bacteroidales bacterium]